MTYLRDELGTLLRILPPPSGFVQYVQEKDNPEWAEILRNDPCSYCGGSGGTVDHVVPRANGGEAAASTNGVGACKECNVRKANMTLLLFLRRMRMEDLQPKPKKNGFFTKEQIRQMKAAVQ